MDDERASELAWQLAELGALPGDPNLFAREAAFREHLYWHLNESTPRRRLQRASSAALSGRLLGELKLQRLRQSVVRLGEEEDVDLHDLQRAIFKAAEFSEETWLGSGLTFETIAGLHGIEDPKLQTRFAMLVRHGAVSKTGTRALLLRYAKLRRRAAYLLGIGITGWMLLVLWAMSEFTEVEASFLMVYLSGTVMLATWCIRQVLVVLSDDIAAVDAATEGLRLRAMQGPGRRK